MINDKSKIIVLFSQLASHCKALPVYVHFPPPELFIAEGPGYHRDDIL
jgi:hypothetical protein